MKIYSTGLLMNCMWDIKEKGKTSITSRWWLVPFIKMGKAGRGARFKEPVLNRSSTLDFLNWKCLLDIQVGISSRQQNV